MWSSQDISLKIAAFRNNKAEFQIMSDLHLEVNQQYQSFHILKTALYLILAGDIGRLLDYKQYLGFLNVQCQKFARVFLVLGNHEFYGLSREEGLRRAKTLEQEPDLNGILVVLNRTRIALEACPDIILLGCTLQSRISPEARKIVNARVKDFQRIENWTVDDHLAEHSLDVDWLQTQIKQIRAEKSTSKHRIIVVSHHAPCIQKSIRPADLEEPLGSAFGTDLLGSGDASVLLDVQVWIFGHTHACADFWKGNVRLVSNQRGYVIPKSPAKSVWLSAFWRSINRSFQVRKVIKI